MSGPGSIDDIARLHWQCRRGMLELDLLLSGFLERRYADLPDEWKRDFVRLLDYPDPILNDWLMGHSVPSEPQMRRLVEMIRQPVEG